jgi:hypothetical protein
MDFRHAQNMLSAGLDFYGNSATFANTIGMDCAD